ncbi:CARDB domain-containing protein [Sandaracinus amylolyticus]|uniref:CARDB domain-containing protein n=1 Tax=Sandaracinus amylolyticus TaxID=927083 RepID=UPI00069CF456|nr:CARDB domain-containing protein [Sandaracinus amylolyticus]
MTKPMLTKHVGTPSLPFAMTYALAVAATLAAGCQPPLACGELLVADDDERVCVCPNGGVYRDGFCYLDGSVVPLDGMTRDDAGGRDAGTQTVDASVDAGLVDAGSDAAPDGEDAGGDVDAGAMLDAGGTPDLTVSCMAADIAGAGSEGRVDIRVTNIGSAAASGFRVRVTATIVGETTRTETIGTSIFVDPIAPLGSATQSVGFTAWADTTAGMIDATCVVDALGEIAEQDEGNNTSTFSFDATDLPDLRGSYAAGSITIRNTGAGNSRGFFVAAWTMGNCLGAPMLERNVAYLAAGGSVRFDGPDPTCARVDVSNMVAETDESNNGFQ